MLDLMKERQFGYRRSQRKHTQNTLHGHQLTPHSSLLSGDSVVKMRNRFFDRMLIFLLPCILESAVPSWATDAATLQGTCTSPPRLGNGQRRRRIFNQPP